jgi:hypothetical protein
MMVPEKLVLTAQAWEPKRSSTMRSDTDSRTA